MFEDSLKAGYARTLTRPTALGLLTQERAGKAFTFTAPADLKQRLAQLSEQDVK
jgi:hypothetical protein